MKQFRQLVLLEKPGAGGRTRKLSFQGLAKVRHTETNTTHHYLEKVEQEADHIKPWVQPKTARDRIQSQPTSNLKRCIIKKPEIEHLEGVPIVTSMTASNEEFNNTEVKLNTQERQEIVEKMHDIKQDLMKELVRNKRKLSVDLNGTLRNIRKELDGRTDKLVEDVLTKRKNKELYLKAREQVKVYFTQKKESQSERQKTFGTPSFENSSNIKKPDLKDQKDYFFNKTMELKKQLPTTGYKLTVTKKSSARTKAIKDSIVTRKCYKAQEDVTVSQFKI